MPGQEMRKKSIRYKLVPQEFEIRDKDVLIVDDSIVRGNTSKEIVRMVREFGAKKIYFVSACPPVKFPCFYGVDMPTRGELTASQRSIDEIKEYMGADILMYQEIDDLAEAVTRKGEHNIDRLCMACLDGQYITGDVDAKKMDSLSLKSTECCHQQNTAFCILNDNTLMYKNKTNLLSEANFWCVKLWNHSPSCHPAT